MNMYSVKTYLYVFSTVFLSRINSIFSLFPHLKIAKHSIEGISGSMLVIPLLDCHFFEMADLKISKLVSRLKFTTAVS